MTRLMLSNGQTEKEKKSWNGKEMSLFLLKMRVWIGTGRHFVSRGRINIYLLLRWHIADGPLSFSRRFSGAHFYEPRRQSPEPDAITCAKVRVFQQRQHFIQLYRVFGK